MLTTPATCYALDRARPQVYTALYDPGSGLTAVRVVYSDESGTGNIRVEPITVVAAVMLNMDSQWEPVSKDLRMIVNDNAARPFLRHGREFKGSRLLKMAPKHAKAREILQAVLEVTSRHRVPIFYAAVDRIGFKRELADPSVSTEQSLVLGRQFRTARKNADATRADILAYVMCLRKVEHYVHATMPREKVLWIADRTSGERPIKGALRLLDYYEAVLNDLPGRPLHIVDTVYFGDSDESGALQLADVCCAVIRAHLEGKDPEHFYNLIRMSVVSDGLRPAFWERR